MAVFMSGKLFFILLVAVSAFSMAYGSEKKTETPSYSFSTQPNYPYTKGGDEFQLVDGVKVARNFWESYETVGWRDIRKVNINFTFKNKTPLNKVCFGTASDERAEVRIPRSATVYISTDGKYYSYFGRFTDDRNTADNRYETKTICISGSATKVKSVVLYLETNGRYLFIDETEFFYETQAIPSPNALSATLDISQPESDWQTQSDSYHDLIAYKWLSSRLLKSLETQPDSIRGQFETLITDFISQTEADFRNSWNLAQNGLPSEFRSIVLNALNAIQPSKIRGMQVSPWSEHSPADVFSSVIPTFNDQDLSTYESGENAFLAANVAYSGTSEEIFSIAVGFDADCMKQSDSALFLATPVLKYDHHYSDDALSPLDNKTISLKGGDIVQIWVRIKSKCTPGIFHGQIRLVNSDKNLYTTIPMSVQITRELSTQTSPLQVNTWAYRATLPKTSTISDAQNDLIRHGINVITIHPNEIPWPKTPCSSKSDCRIDATGFVNILKEYPVSTQFLLFMGFNNPLANREAYFGSDIKSRDWSTSMTLWATTVLTEIQKAGISPQRIAFYPVDEPNDNAMSYLLTLSASALHKATPRARVFGTYTGNQVPSVVNAVSSLDIVQVLLDKIDNAEIDTLHKQGVTVWTYTAEGGGKAADPTTFYRLQAWKAYAHNIKGIGFWAYYDSSESTWSDFDGAKPDYSVIYETENGFVSSKRWEAWSQGIRDYGLLTYADSTLTGNNLKKFHQILGEVTQTKITAERFMRIRKQLVELLPSGSYTSPPQKTILKVN